MTMDVTELVAEEVRLWALYMGIRVDVTEAEGVVERLKAKGEAARVAWDGAADRMHYAIRQGEIGGQEGGA